jgi:hypothetical protein
VAYVLAALIVVGVLCMPMVLRWEFDILLWRMGERLIVNCHHMKYSWQRAIEALSGYAATRSYI